MIKVSEHFYSRISEIEYFKLEFTNYYIETIDKTTYLAASRQDISGEFANRKKFDKEAELYIKWNTGFSYVRLRSFDALVDLLKLAEDIFLLNKSWEPVYSLSILGGYAIDGMVCHDDSKNKDILSFAKKYGYISLTSVRFRDLLLEKDGSERLRLKGQKLEDYVKNIYDIYRLYLIWCYLQWEERGDFEKYIYTCAYDIDERNYSLEKLSRSTIARKADGLETSTKFRYRDNILIKSAYSEDLYAALFTQLFELISLGDMAMDGNIVANCSRCGTSYLKKHGNSSLCEMCKTPKAKSKAFRDKERLQKKEASRNGKETRE
ncbi:MAG: hypothetical protein GX096_07995 [Clostridiales bacterium]|nr:hypothetical protein [Clostridiales bacterium]